MRRIRLDKKSGRMSKGSRVRSTRMCRLLMHRLLNGQPNRLWKKLPMSLFLNLRPLPVFHQYHMISLQLLRI